MLWTRIFNNEKSICQLENKDDHYTSIIRFLMNQIIRVFLFSTVALYSTNLFAQKLSNLVFQQFGPNNGLPSVEVYDIHQDDDGYIWICTDKGICRYDGYVFNRYDNSTSNMPDNTVFKAFEIGQEIWFNCYDGSIVRYNKVDHTFKSANALEQSEKGDWVYDITYNESIITVVYQYSNCFFTINRETGMIKKNQLNPDSLKELIKIRNKRLYKNPETPNYIVVSDHTNKNTIMRKKHFLNKSEWLLIHGQSILWFKNDLLKSNTTLREIVIDIKIVNREIFVCTENGLLKLNRKQEFDTLYYNGTVTDIIQDSEGIYWISTINSGILKLTSFAKTKFNVGLKDKSTVCEMKVFKNFLILGATDGTYSVLNSNAIKPVLVDSTTDGAAVKSLCLLNKGLIINGEKILIEKGANLIQKNTELYSNPRFLFFDNAYLCALIPAGYVIGKLYNGTYGELKQYHFNQKILQMEPDRELIYMATLNGLYAISKDNLNAPYPCYTKKIPRVRINKVIVRDSFVFVATSGKGIFCILNNKTVVRVSKSSTSITNSIEFINGGILLVGTNQGIDKYQFSFEGDHPLFTYLRSYSSKDYLISDYIYSMAYYNGYLYYSTDKGISRISPDKETGQFDPPKLYIEDIKVGNLLNPENLSNLKHYQNNVLIRYIGISNSKPEKEFYRYKIITNNQNSAWEYTDSRELRLNNLSPGKYDIYIAARNYQNVWSKPEIITLGINPGIIQRLWFQILIGLIFLSATTIIVRLRLNSIKQKQIERDTLNKLKLMYNDASLSSLKSQIKPHFIFNALQSIQAYVLKNKPVEASEYLDMFSRLIRSGLQYSTLDFISINDEVVFLEHYMQIERLRFPNRFNYKISVDPELTNEDIKIPPLMTQPFCENAIKHAFAFDDKTNNIHISFTFGEKPDSILCIIQDNGKGIYNSSKKGKLNKHRSMGLELIKKRINLLSDKYGMGEFSIQTDKGTRVEIVLPAE